MDGYRLRIFQHIESNEPITRKELVKEFRFITAKTVYQNIRQLLAAKKIFEDEYGQLTVSSPTDLSWSIPKFMQTFTNISPVGNGFARKNPEFIKMAQELSQKHGEKLALILYDIIIIANLPKIDDLAPQFKHNKRVDVHALTQYFNTLEELISNYNNPDYTLENEKS